MNREMTQWWVLFVVFLGATNSNLQRAGADTVLKIITKSKEADVEGALRPVHSEIPLV